MSKSEWDGSKLPEIWNRIAPYSKGLIIGYLQHRHNDPVPCWDNMPFQARKEVILHLCAVGSVNAYDHPRVTNLGGLDALTATQKARQSKNSVMMDAETSTLLAAIKNFAQCSRPFVTFGGGYRDGGYVRQGVRSRTVDEPTSMLYPKPNDGKRILPSIYTTLRESGCELVDCGRIQPR